MYFSLCLFAFNKIRTNVPASNITGVQLADHYQQAYLGINLIVIDVIVMQLCNQVRSRLYLLFVLNADECVTNYQ